MASDVPAVLVGLLSPKPRSEKRQAARFDSAGENPWRDVRRIELMMRERRLGIAARGLAMHEWGWPERRRADQVGRSDKGDSSMAPAVRAAQFHQQFVGMLPIDERSHLIRLAGLEELRRTDRLHRQRFEREHAFDLQLSAAHRPRAVKHEPVLRLERGLIRELPGLHNDCPEINIAGYLVPGQSRATDPITHLTPCGFHDHNHEGNPAYGGTVTAVAR